MPKVKYTWNEALRRYETTGGRPVAWGGASIPGAPMSVFARFQQQVDVASARMRAIALQYQAGAINLPEWQLQMQSEVKTIMGLAAVTARGGWGQMSLSDWGRLGAATRFHYDRLNQFALQVEQGLPLDGRFLNRATFYARSARNVFWNMTMQFRQSAGIVTRIARVRNARESCAGCIAADVFHLGFLPVDVMLQLHPIGSKQCMFNCLCEFIFEDEWLAAA